MKFLARPCCVFTLILLPLTATADQQNIVDLHFDWPTDLKATVHYRITKTKNTFGESKERTVKGNYQLQTEAHKDGIQINLTGFNVNVERNDAHDGPHAKMQDFMAQASNSFPGYVVNPQGKLIDIVKLDALRDSAIEKLGTILNTYPSALRDRMALLMERIFSKQQIFMQIQEQWDRDVGHWANTQFQKGVVYQTRFSTNAPLFNNLSIPAIANYEYLGKAACNKEDTKQSCIELAMESHIDEEALLPALQSLGLLTGSEPVNHLKMDYRVHLITEPGTLLPHHVSATKVVSAVTAGDKSKNQHTDQVDVFYSYADSHARIADTNPGAPFGGPIRSGQL